MCRHKTSTAVHNGELFAPGLFKRYDMNRLHLILLSVIHSGNSLTISPFPLWMARSESVFLSFLDCLLLSERLKKEDRCLLLYMVAGSHDPKQSPIRK